MCVSSPQAGLGVCRQRPGRAAALLVQLGGGAGAGGAAAGGEPAPGQRLRPHHLLRRRCPGPKVKTIPSCTSLPTHLLYCHPPLRFCCSSFLLFFFLLFCFFLYPYVFMETDGCIGSLSVCANVCVYVCVCFHEQSHSHCVCWVFVLPPRSKITQRGDEVASDAVVYSEF